LRIKIRSALGHQSQIVVRCSESVLDLRAAGEGGRADSVPISVHERAQALFRRFVTRACNFMETERAQVESGDCTIGRIRSLDW